MMEYPLWATPQRRAILVEMALANPLAYEVDLITGNLLNPALEDLIDYWQDEDRDERSYLWKLEKRWLHRLYPQIRRRGPWDSIRMEQYLADRPIFEIVAIGVSALTFKRMAEVRIPALKATLWVDLSHLELSKNKLRKLARYKKGAVPKELQDQIENRCRQAVQRYLNKTPGA